MVTASRNVLMASMQMMDEDDLLSSGEVARLFHVSTRTVMRWSDAGKLQQYTRTLGNHRRFRAGEVRQLLAAAQDTGG